MFDFIDDLKGQLRRKFSSLQWEAEKAVCREICAILMMRINTI